HGIEFLSSYFYEHSALPTDHFNAPLNIWRLDPFELARAHDKLVAESKTEFEASASLLVRPQFGDVYAAWEKLTFPTESSTLNLSKVRMEQDAEDPTGVLPISTSDVRELVAAAKATAGQASQLAEVLNRKLHEWKNLSY